MPRVPPHLALSLMPESGFARAAQPLFEAGEIDAVEWSFDIGWGGPALPAWLTGLLDVFEKAGRLYGHGVGFSPLSAQWEERQAVWLARFEEECARRRYRHVSEHFGFSTAAGFERGAPMPVPRTAGAVSVGRDRLARMRAASGGRPIGLENLALAFGATDVREQGGFLRELLAPDGFVVLDLHNLHCQASNFGIDPDDLLAGYPLDRVRELHLSGGSWSSPASDPQRKRFRRDTHDGPVPEPVTALLPRALARCPAVEVVVMERIGTAFDGEPAWEEFRRDARRVRAVLRGGT